MTKKKIVATNKVTIAAYNLILSLNAIGGGEYLCVETEIEALKQAILDQRETMNLTLKPGQN